MTDLALPRASQYALLLSLVLLAMVHIRDLPWWVMACSATVFVVYLGQVKRQWPPVPNAVRSLVAVASLAAIALHYQSVRVVDAYISLLLMMHAQKLLELKTDRDLFFAVYIGMFAAVTRLLYFQAFTDVFIALVTGICCFYVLYARHNFVSVSILSALRNVLMLMLKAAPLAAVLFFLFPRIPPMMVLPELTTSGTSGVSNIVEPGSIARLAKSTAPAFRVEFEGETPPRDSLYWRGVVLDRYNGSAWRTGQLLTVNRDWLKQQQSDSNSLAYTVRMEPTNQHWLFSLAVSYSTTSESGDISGFLVASPKTIASPSTYPLVQVNVPMRQRLSAQEIQRLTYIPEGANPQTVAWGQSLANQYATVDEIVAAISHKVETEFSYSLEAPLLGKNNADDFLFGTKIGYCEHFANAAGVALRAAGVPTRLVGGYLGGEQNPFEDYVLVRQLDAHAWLEYWQAETGWVRYDPTAFVAPDRILEGSEASLRARNQLVGGWRNMSNIKVLQQLYQWADAQNYQFGRWLEDYDRGKQFSLVENLFGVEGNSANLASVFFIAAVFVTLPFTVVALLGLFGSRLPLQFTLLVADKGLSLAGLKRPRAIPPLQWSQQCAELPASYRSLTAVWYRVWYQSNASPRFLLRLNCMRLALSVLLWGVFQGLMGGKGRSTSSIS